MKIIIPALSSVVRKDEEDMGDSGRRGLGEEQELQSLLSRKKLRLVLDLDHTLVHCTPVSKLSLQDSAKMKTSVAAVDTHYLDGGALVLKFRPGVGSFLEEASAMFDLSIYTMGTRHYANQVAARLVLDRGHQTPGRGSSLLSFVEVISREDCTVERQKGLDAVSSHRRAVLVVDDKVKVWAREDRDNVLAIAPYYFFGAFINNQLSGDQEDDDRELSRVLGVLREVHSTFFQGDDYHYSMDVAQVLKRVRLLMLYHGPPSYHPNILQPHHHHRHCRHEDKKEEEDGGNKIKKIKIVFGRRTTTNLACQGNELRCRKRGREEEEEEEESVAWGPIMMNQSRRHSTNNNSIISCRVNQQLQACVR